MRDNILIHVPHSSLYLPKCFFENIIINKEDIERENIFISDYLVNLFLPENTDNILKFNYSRLFCDVERFRNDEQENMSKYGMGAIYEKESNGITYINVTGDYKNRILNEIYDVHHKTLDDMVTKIIDKYGYCIIIDLHSYSDVFVKKMFNYENCPDICIGYEDNFIDEKILDIARNTFSKYGYTIKDNYPYSGSIVPNKFYKTHENRVKSIMIETNKRIYLDNDINLNEEKSLKLKRCLNDFYGKL